MTRLDLDETIEQVKLRRLKQIIMDGKTTTTLSTNCSKDKILMDTISFISDSRFAHADLERDYLLSAAACIVALIEMIDNEDKKNSLEQKSLFDSTETTYAEVRI